MPGRSFGALCPRNREISQTHQVVGRYRQGEIPVNLGHAPVAGLAQIADGLDPTEHLLDALADAQTQRIARMARGATIDGRAALALRVLGHMGRDLQPAQIADELLGIVALVGTQRDALFACHIGDHLRGGFALSRAVGLGDHRLDDQAVAILHQGMAEIAHACLFAFALFVESRFGIGDRGVCFVGELFTVKVTRLIATHGPGGIIILGPEALDGGPGFDERAVNAEMLIRQEPGLAGLRHDLGQKKACNLGMDQPLQVGGKARVVPDLLVQGQAHKPAKENVVVDLFNEQTIAANGVEGLQEQGLEQLLGGNGRAARVGIELFEVGVEFDQGLVHHGPDGPQGVGFGYKGFGREIDKHRFGVALNSAHNFLQQFQSITRKRIAQKGLFLNQNYLCFSTTC